MVIATNVPLLPHQLHVVAKHCAHGIARTGGLSGISSGDFAVAFSTANKGLYPLLYKKKNEAGVATLQVANDDLVEAVYSAAAYATEEAILNAMVSAEEMIGYRGAHVRQLPFSLVRAAFETHKKNLGLFNEPRV